MNLSSTYLNPASPSAGLAISITGRISLTCRQTRYLHDRADFDGAQACRGNPCGDADRLVQILGVDEEVAAQLLARLRERPVGYQRFAGAHPDAGRRRDRVQRVGGQILTLG